jgi:hypothetical protein
MLALVRGSKVRGAVDDRCLGGLTAGEYVYSGCCMGAGKGGEVPDEDRRCLYRYIADRGGLLESSRFKVERVRGSWLEKDEDLLELGDAPGDWAGGV